MEFESDIPNIPDHHLSEKQFLLQGNQDKRHRETIFKELIESIKGNDLAPYYKYLKEEYSDFPFDQKVYETLNAKNETELNQLKKNVKEAEGEEETELDIVTCTTKLAEYYTKIIDRKNATDTYKHALTLSQGTGSKIDILLALIRIEYFFNDFYGASKYLDQIQGLIDKGGDWERRNRYKTYHGIYLVATRKFSEASQLLTDSLATFTSSELCSYDQIALYAIVSGILSLERLDLKSKIGVLRTFDQFANLVLQDTLERVYLGKEGSQDLSKPERFGEIYRGVFMVRGENVVMMGELDIDHEDDHLTTLQQLPFEIAEQELKLIQKERVKQEKQKTKDMLSRGLINDFIKSDLY